MHVVDVPGLAGAPVLHALAVDHALQHVGAVSLHGVGEPGVDGGVVAVTAHADQLVQVGVHPGSGSAADAAGTVPNLQLGVVNADGLHGAVGVDDQGLVDGLRQHAGALVVAHHEDVVVRLFNLLDAQNVAELVQIQVVGGVPQLALHVGGILEEQIFVVNGLDGSVVAGAVGSDIAQLAEGGVLIGLVAGGVVGQRHIRDHLHLVDGLDGVVVVLSVVNMVGSGHGDADQVLRLQALDHGVVLHLDRDRIGQSGSAAPLGLLLVTP